MNLANFCRNCLSKWYKSAAEDRGVKIDYESARQIIYDMPYSDWKKKYQTEASLEQKEKLNSKKSINWNRSGIMKAGTAFIKILSYFF